MSRAQDWLIYPGIAKRIEYDAPGGGASSLSIALRGAPVPWRFRVFALGSNEGERSGEILVGCVRSLPWVGNGDHLVAVACCPGARTWAIDAQPETRHLVGGVPPIALNLLASNCCGLPGVQAVQGASLPGAQSLRFLSGVSGGPLAVPGVCTGWTATAGAVDATVLISMDGFPLGVPIVIPAGYTLSDEFPGTSGTSVGFTFTDTVSYLIDYELVGDGLDAY